MDIGFAINIGMTLVLVITTILFSCAMYVVQEVINEWLNKRARAGRQNPQYFMAAIIASYFLVWVLVTGFLIVAIALVWLL